MLDGIVVQNDPVDFTDPTGKFIFLAPAIAIGAEAIGGVAGHAVGATIVAGIGAWIYNQSIDDDFDDSTPVDKPAIPDENCWDDFCRKEKEAIIVWCSEHLWDPDLRHVHGGSMQQCINNLLPTICGGEGIWKGYK